MLKGELGTLRRGGWPGMEMAREESLVKEPMYSVPLILAGVVMLVL